MVNLCKMPNLCISRNTKDQQCNRILHNDSNFYCRKHFRNTAINDKNNKYINVLKKVIKKHVPNILCDLILEYSSEFGGHVDHVIRGSNINEMIVANGKIITDSPDNTLMVWDLVSGRCEHELFGHTGQILKTITLFSGDIASCSYGYGDGVIIWDSSTWKYKKNYIQIVDT